MALSPSPKMILSIQSHVAYGHVGNAAAVFALQRLGFEVVPIHTVQFSNHTGYGSFRGQVFTQEHIHDIITGLKERDVLGRIDAVLSGYMGDGTIGNAILDAVKEVRQLNPGARYLCDPVMGDMGRGVYVNPNIPDFMCNEVVPVANIITPNHFEFEILVDSKLADISDTIAKARALIEKTKLETVVVTSLSTQDIPKGQLGTLAVTKTNAWMVLTPYVDITPPPTGTGDTLASILLGRILQGYAIDKALVLATSSLYALVSKTPAGNRDLPLVAEQNEIVMPSRAFDVMAVN